jgi:hypothetical protein
MIIDAEALRDPASFAQVIRENPHGCEWSRDVRLMVSDIVDALDRLLPDNAGLALHADEGTREIAGVIIFVDGETYIVPVTVSRNLLFVRGKPIYTGHRNAVMRIVDAIATEVESFL